MAVENEPGPRADQARIGFGELAKVLGPSVIPGPGARPHPQPQTREFPFVFLDDVQVGGDPPSLIQGVMPNTGLMAVYGPPKSGKSFLLTDALFHIAAGFEEWSGCPIHSPGGTIIYFTGEGVTGYRRRLVALRLHYDKRGVPFIFVPVAPNMGASPGEAEEIVRQVRKLVADHNLPPVAAVAIDTLARSMYGADESSAKDMAQFVSNCDLVARELSCLVVIVCHTGWDNLERPKGSIALVGSLDMAWLVRKTETSNEVTTRFVKDFEEGLTWQFTLNPFELGNHVSTGEPVRTQIVSILSVPGERSGQKKQKRGRPRSAPDPYLFQQIKEAMHGYGEVMPAGGKRPAGSRGLKRSRLKEFLKTIGWNECDKPQTQERSLTRALQKMAGNELLSLDREWIWGVSE